MHGMPLPPEQLRERVAGAKDAQSFQESGSATLDEWTRALDSIGREFGDFETIVDFGCGCGRALRHLQARIKSTSQTLIGLDPDAEAIEWLNSNFSNIRGYTLNAMPPSPLAAGSADLVVSHSVFTHLPEDVQYAWLEELHRILKPGAIAITTIHGDHAFSVFEGDLVRGGQNELRNNLSNVMERSGFLYIKGRTAAETPLPDYYGATFHDISYIKKNWSKYFSILAWFPKFALNLQDTLVLQRR